ncbi:hypothetical protein BKA81DRAFT_147138 [Phyllosticta paracitricarpa]
MAASRTNCGCSDFILEIRRGVAMRDCGMGGRLGTQLGGSRRVRDVMGLLKLRVSLTASGNSAPLIAAGVAQGTASSWFGRQLCRVMGVDDDGVAVHRWGRLVLFFDSALLVFLSVPRLHTTTPYDHPRRACANDPPTPLICPLGLNPTQRQRKDTA